MVVVTAIASTACSAQRLAPVVEPKSPGCAAGAYRALRRVDAEAPAGSAVELVMRCAERAAPWVRSAKRSKLQRIALLGMFGGTKGSRTAGVYLEQDYDPDKQPLVLIHGLGSSPLIWATLSDAVWGDAELRSRYQVWHLVYQSNAPLLSIRRRAQSYLDEAWQILDPEGDDRARQNMTLVGHSLGGVVARMLCADSGEALWRAAFVAPLDEVDANATDRGVLAETFYFSAYPGVRTAIFLAAPHRGSPTASGWLGRVVRRLVGRRVPEIRALADIARANPQAIRPELRDAYRDGWVNSISTLQSAQPVRLASETLSPAPGIAYHTIAGVLPRRGMESDGVVPLASALLDGAASTLVVEGDHRLYDNPAAGAEVLRILRGPTSAAR